MVHIRADKAVNRMFQKAPALKLASTMALAFMLASCGDNAPAPVAVSPTPAPMPVPPPTPTPTSFNVSRCLSQTAVPGRSVADLVVPDLLRLDLDSLTDAAGREERELHQPAVGLGGHRPQRLDLFVGDTAVATRGLTKQAENQTRRRIEQPHGRRGDLGEGRHDRRHGGGDPLGSA